MTRALENQNITQRSIEGGVWLFGRGLIANSIRLFAIAILARHLSSGDFGLVALAQVLLQFLVFAADNGIGTYVIFDREEGWENRASSAFWLNLTMTACQLLLLGAAVPFVYHIYAKRELLYVLAALAVVFVFQQLAVIPEALVRRKLEYRPLVIRDTACDVISASLSVGLALTGWGVWSLVLPQIIVGPIRLVAILLIARWIPAATLGITHWPKILRYSTNLVATNFLGLVANDGDSLLVGKVLGTGALGYYNMAWQLSNLIGRNVTAVVSSVAFPALAMLDQNMGRLQKAYRRLLRLLAAVSFPCLLLMFALADELVQVIYGPRWEPVVTLLRIFIVFTLIRSVTSPCSLIYNVVGRTDVGFKFTVTFLPFYLVAIYLGSGWGLIGVATGVTIVRTIGGVNALALSTRLIHLSFLRVVADLAPAGGLALLASVVAWAINSILVWQGFIPLARLCFCGAVAGVLYCLGLALFDRETYLEINKLISSVLPGIRTKLDRFVQRPLLAGARK